MHITKFNSGLSLSETAQAPLYVQLANALGAKIQSAELPKGTKLPPERELARLLAISRTTTLNAYRLLEERGLVLSRRGSGTYVDNTPATAAESRISWNQIFSPSYKSPFASLLRTLIAAPTGEDNISLAAGMPDPAFYPLAELEEIVRSAKPSVPPADYGYLATEGYFPLRRALAAWQEDFGIQATPDQFLVVSGSQQGLYLTVKTLVEPQDYVIVEAPTYLGAIQSLEAAGARLLTLPIDAAGGFDFSLLEDYLIRYRPKLMYTIPTFHNPTGRVMTLSDRRRLIDLSARYRLVIIEDDPYGLLYYDALPPASLKSLDTYGGVIQLGTFSKTLLPGLRTGWVLADQPVIDRLAQEKQHVDLHCNNLSQLLLTAALQSGLIDRHLHRIRCEYKNRRDAMVQALRQYGSDSLEFSVPAGGFYIWCRLKQPLSVTDLMHRAAASGVGFVPGIAFYTSGSTSQELRLCFATHDPATLREGVRRLGRLLRQLPPAAGHIPAAGQPLI